MDFKPWNIQKIISKGDYNYAYVPDHPHSTINGYVLEHRIVMENKIGRLLTDKEIIHHKDEVKKNNLVDNLEIKSKSAHARDHQFERGRETCIIKCPHCKDVFIRYKSNTHLSKGGIFCACSPSCRGKFSRKIQIEGLTEENKKYISENIVKEFMYHGILIDNVRVAQLEEQDPSKILAGGSSPSTDTTSFIEKYNI